MTGKRRPLAFWVAIFIVQTGLLIYSQLVAYFGNESFHLLAAQLINAGKRPYLDFFYQHAPLYAYLNAVWMRLFGESWQSAHVLSALMVGGGVWVVADYLFSRLHDRRWRLTIAILAALLMGLNFYVICFGTVGLPFGLCLFLTTAAFRLTLAAINREKSWLAFCAGICAAAAAASSLFTAPVMVVLWLWLLRDQGAGNRWKKCVAFLAGAIIPLLPLMWLFTQSPRQTFFNLVEYHFFYRVETTGNPWRWNLREMVEWFASYQGLLLVPLAFIGIWLVSKRNEFDAQRKSEFYLCACLIIVLSLCLSMPRPTFAFYFVLLTPFVSILASLGFYAIGSRVRHFKIKWLALVLLALYGFGLAGRVYKSRLEIFNADHKTIEVIAREINQNTPADGSIYAFEHVYFEARRMPPPGLENAFNPFSKADDWLREGRFNTICMMANDPRIKSFALFERYANNQTIEGTNFKVIIFWGILAPSPDSSQAP
jgi:hypothetical protein